MFELMIEDHFDSAHFLAGYEGNCNNLHGHRFKIRVHVQGQKLNKIGLLLDYKSIKTEVKKMIADLDHKVLNEVLNFNPTSELMAEYFYHNLKAVLPQEVTLSKIEICESENTRASYYE